jgi:hypothetical protein
VALFSSILSWWGGQWGLARGGGGAVLEPLGEQGFVVGRWEGGDEVEELLLLEFEGEGPEAVGLAGEEDEFDAEGRLDDCLVDLFEAELAVARVFTIYVWDSKPKE